MKLLFFAFLFDAFSLSAAIIKLSSDNKGPIYQNVPFEGNITLSPYRGNKNELQKEFSNIEGDKFLYIVKMNNMEQTQDSLKVSGIFSLLSLPETVELNGTTYTIQSPNSPFVKSKPAQSIISLKHDYHKFWPFSRKWTFVLLFFLLVLSIGCWKIFLKWKFKKSQREQAIKVVLLFQKAESRKEFETIYLKKELIYKAFTLQAKKNPLDETPLKLKKIFEKINKNLYIRNWSQELLQELIKMKNTV